MFPFALPPSTAFYLTLYLLTFAVHQAFMHYVLAGSFYVAWTATFPGTAELPRSEQPLAKMVRDWMPFSLGAAITAGIAPLLFVQILYPREFYTANLLLGWRWMLLIPALIVGFYLLYLQKSRTIAGWPRAVRTSCALATVLCFLFVGFGWTMNHTISNQQSAWATIYGEQTIPFDAATLTRLGIWIAAAFPTLSAFAGWQFVDKQVREDAECDSYDPQARLLAGLSLAGLLAGTVFTVSYISLLGSTVRSEILGSAGLPWLLLASVGVALQVLGWIVQWRGQGFCRMRLWLVTAGWLLTLLGISVLREIIRITSIDIAALSQRHADSAQIGGLTEFLLFAVMNGALIVYCIRMVRRSQTKTAE